MRLPDNPLAEIHSSAKDVAAATRRAIYAEAAPIQMPKDAATTILAALGLAAREAQKQQGQDRVPQERMQGKVLLDELPLFVVHSPQREACVGSHVVLPRKNSDASAATGEAAAANHEETASPAADSEMAASFTTAASAQAGGSRSRSSSSNRSSRNAHSAIIREYESQFLSAVFASDDENSKCLPEL